MNSQVTKNFDRSSFELFTKSFALRQKMLNFLQNLEYYMTFEVSRNSHVVNEINVRVGKYGIQTDTSGC